MLVQSFVMARNIDAAWEEMADIQQVGLDAALAAQCKARKSKSSIPAAAGAGATANGLQSQSHDSNGNAEASSAPPDQDTASRAGAGHTGTGLEVQDNGLPASEENQAANRQLSASAHMPASSVGKDQVRSSLCVCIVLHCTLQCMAIRHDIF